MHQNSDYLVLTIVISFLESGLQILFQSVCESGPHLHIFNGYCVFLPLGKLVITEIFAKM